MVKSEAAPVGVILAGGRGSRLGGEKATAQLAGRPLIAYPLAAMQAVLGDALVLAKPSTRLPVLEGVRIAREAEEPVHPLAGIHHALALAEGRAVLVCAVDLPLVTAGQLRALAEADAGGAPAVVAAGERGLQPLLARYEPQAARLLPAEGRLIEAVEAIAPRRLGVSEELSLFNVNTPRDVRRAEAILGAASRT